MHTCRDLHNIKGAYSRGVVKYQKGSKTIMQLSKCLCHLDLKWVLSLHSRNITCIRCSTKDSLNVNVKFLDK
jgi:hypothetical protein